MGGNWSGKDENCYRETRRVDYKSLCFLLDNTTKKLYSELGRDRKEWNEVKQWEKKVYEVYFRKHNRIFYVAADEQNLYLLHACRKQKNQTEKTDKKIVIKRAKELGKILGKTFI